MAETEVATTNSSTETKPTADQIQLQEFERMAFGGTKPANTASTTSEPAATNTDTQTTDTTNTTPVTDYTPFVKETFGVETVEEAKQQWLELQTLKANPPKAEPFKFENAESEKLARAINSNPKEAFKILEKQEKIESLLSLEVNADNAANIIKLGMELKYPTLTPAQIDFQYKQDYGIPKEPVLKDTDDQEDFNERHEAWKEQVSNIQMKAIIAATMAKPELEAAKQKIVLPDIQPTATTVDKDYEAYKASNASAEQFYNAVSPQINALKVNDVPLTVNINDANNKMQFDISIVPEETDFEAARQDSLSMDVFKTCYDKDGKFIPQNLQRISLIAKNFDKYAQSIARQAVNAERKRVLEEKTGDGGTRRDFNTTVVEPTELQKLEKMAFG